MLVHEETYQKIELEVEQRKDISEHRQLDLLLEHDHHDTPIALAWFPFH